MDAACHWGRVFVWIPVAVLASIGVANIAMAIRPADRLPRQRDDAPMPTVLQLDGGEPHEARSASIPGGMFGVIPGDAAQPARYIQCVELQP